MHALNDVPAVVEDPPNVLRVDGAREMRVTVVAAVLFRVAVRRLLADLQTEKFWTL